MAPFPMTLSDLQGQAGNTSLFRCFLNSRAAVDKVLTDTARRGASATTQLHHQRVTDRRTNGWKRGLL